jgi:hypothetical protein
MEGQIGALQVDIGPDQLDDLVLGHAPLAAVVEEGEECLRLAGAGLGPAPLAYCLHPPFGAERPQRKEVQPLPGRIPGFDECP